MLVGTTLCSSTQSATMRGYYITRAPHHQEVERRGIHNLVYEFCLLFDGTRRDRTWFLSNVSGSFSMTADCRARGQPGIFRTCQDLSSYTGHLSRATACSVGVDRGVIIGVVMSPSLSCHVQRYRTGLEANGSYQSTLYVTA